MAWVRRALKALIPPHVIDESYGEQFQAGEENTGEGKVGIFLWREGSTLLGWGSLLHWKQAESFSEGWSLDVGLRKPEGAARTTA